MRSALLVATLAAAPALAQDIAADTTYEAGGQLTLIKVVEPEGATCQLAGDGQAGQQTVPFAQHAAPHMFYDVTCTLPGGAVWTKKVEARANQIAVIRLKAGNNQAGNNQAGSATPVVVKIEPAGPQAMEGGAFAALKSAVDDASFSDDKLNLIRAAAGGNHFTIAQVGGLVDALDHSSDKVAAVEILRAKVIDPGNAFQLGRHFTFSSDKEKVLGLFK